MFDSKHHWFFSRKRQGNSYETSTVKELFHKTGENGAQIKELHSICYGVKRQ